TGRRSGRRRRRGSLPVATRLRGVPTGTADGARRRAGAGRLLPFFAGKTRRGRPSLRLSSVRSPALSTPHRRRAGSAARLFTGLGLASAAALLAACSAPDTVPLTPKEQQDLAWLKKTDPNAGKIEERGTLFMSLDQNLRTWRKLTMSTEVGDISQRQ